MISNQFDCLVGGGEMGALMRSFDWSKTAIGPQEGWPASLKTALGMLLHTGYPMYIAWGPQFIQLYNDAYRPILGSKKHPGALGSSTFTTFAEIWDFIGPMFQGVMNEGTASTYIDQLLALDRHGFVEECYFTFSYSAIRDEAGTVGGVLVTVLETTERVLHERRQKILRDLLDMRSSRKHTEILLSAAAILETNPNDIPFGALYRKAESGFERAGLVGCEPDDPAERVLREHERKLAALAAQGQVSTLSVTTPAKPTINYPWPEPVQSLAAVPVTVPGQAEPTLVVLAGLSPRLPFDAGYESFFRSLSQNIASVLAEAEAYEHERRKAEELAELDRAKTLFFSNISHEFRTPLTLMMGPIEDVLNDSAIALAGTHRRQLELAHRNAMRLLRLVNTLLDFSRIELGRIEATFLPVDLSTRTTELAGVFRAAIEKAGLKLKVDCPPLPEPIFIDPEMWEKIILNLLSNALKFTFEGEIEVRLRWQDGGAELIVRDTGTGIAPENLPHLFERFYRIPNVRSRSHEGSGIGLALVHELVKLHRGEIEVESKLGLGTRFSIRLKAGKDHLPADRIEASKVLAPTPAVVHALVEEADHWLPLSDMDRDGGQLAFTDVRGRRSRVLLADDNADMREYLTRLLSPYWEVEALPDGAAALESARKQPPDLVLADVMMPRMDGFELLRALRKDERTRAIPIILLSARAGEEARVEGIDAGADDYLTKPFSARELIARLRTHLEMSKSRSELAQKQVESEAWFKVAVKSARLGVWEADVTSWDGQIDAQMATMVGLSADKNNLSAEEWRQIIHPDDRSRVLQEFGASIAERKPLDVEFRVNTSDGAVRWLASHGDILSFPLDGKRRLVGVAQDITDRKKSAERQQLLLNELNHRVRNTLTTVLSLAKQTASSADTIDNFTSAFQARVLALSRAHSLLTRRNWESVSLRDIIQETLAPHTVDGAVQIKGTDCDLGASHALALTLGLHELATNACKYGALTYPTGRIEIEWESTVASSARTIRLDWRERGGPRVVPPSRRGFGSRLLERALAIDLNGAVQLDFAPEGVCCSIAFAVDDVRREPLSHH